MAEKLKTKSFETCMGLEALEKEIGYFLQTEHIKGEDIISLSHASKVRGGTKSPFSSYIYNDTSWTAILIYRVGEK